MNDIEELTGDVGPEDAAAWSRRLATLQACLAVSGEPRLRQALVVEAERIIAAMGGGSAARLARGRTVATSRRR